MKNLKLLIVMGVVAASAGLAGCSKTEPAAENKPAAEAGAAAGADAQKQEPEVRQATYDPNLKPAEIVWDSPEKKKRWEELQKEIQAKKAAQPNQGQQ